VTDLSEFEKKPRHKLQHPNGWEPGIEWDRSKGGKITAVLDSEPDESIWAMLIKDWGLDPERTEVVGGSLQIRAWDAPDPEGGLRRLFYYRATIKPRERTGDQEDLEALRKLVEKRKPKPVKLVDTNRVFFMALSDWQLGKGGEVEGGTTETVDRVFAALERALARASQMRKFGIGSDTVVMAGLGDLVEGCGNDWYAMGAWSQDKNQREQDRIARRLILAYIDAFVDAGYRVIAPCVPGNHGENRAGGKAFTDFTDNRDVSCFETVREVIAMSSKYDQVSIPLELNSDDLTATMEIGGLPVTFAHGHQFRSGANAAAKMEGWWKGQALGRQSAADAEMIICGHGHHFAMSEATGRTVVQVPAMDGGSKWWTSTTGQSSPSGMLTMNIGLSAGPRGWGDLAIV